MEYRELDLASLAAGLPDEVANYKAAGAFAQAEEAIDRWMKRPVAEMMKQRLRLEKRLLKGLREDFPYTEEEAVAAFAGVVPDFGPEDLRRLDECGLAEWIYLDGEKHYIHNLVRNVTQKDEEIMRRANLPDTEEEERRLLQEEISRIRKEGGYCWRFRLRASIRLGDAFFVPGTHLRVHLPIPANLHQCSDVKILEHSPGEVSIDRADSLFRSICFEETVQENHAFFVEYEYTMKEAYHDLTAVSDAVQGKDGSGKAGDFEKTSMQDCETCKKEELEAFLQEQQPHIRFTPYLCALASEITEGKTSDLEKAAAIYDYITKKVQYSYMREYFLIPDIPQYCARNLRGDCGVQALLFITLCRICRIPAKWQSGLYFAGRDWVGPHDWALFYAAGRWLYADPSLGGAAYKEGDEVRRRFYFGNLDPFRVAANNAFQKTFAVPKRFLPADPYDNQVGEMESEERGFSGREVVTEKQLILAERLPYSES